MLLLTRFVFKFWTNQLEPDQIVRAIWRLICSKIKAYKEMRNFSKMKFKRRTTIGANPSIGLSFKTYNDRPQPRVRVMRCQSFKKVLNKIMKQLTSSFPNINLKGWTDSKICHQFEILSQVRAFYRKPNRRANLIAVWVQKSLGGEKEVCFKASCIISQESQRTRNSWPPVRTPT